MNHEEVAKKIVNLVGGKENIQSLTHCITRLRFVLNDESLADEESIKNIKGVISVIRRGGQFQVVIGQEVKKVYSEVMKLGNFENSPIKVDLPKKKIKRREFQ